MRSLDLPTPCARLPDATQNEQALHRFGSLLELDPPVCHVADQRRNHDFVFLGFNRGRRVLQFANIDHRTTLTAARSLVRRRTCSASRSVMTSHPGISSPWLVEPTQRTGPAFVPFTTMRGIRTRDPSRRYALSMYPVLRTPGLARTVPILKTTVISTSSPGRHDGGVSEAEPKNVSGAESRLVRADRCNLLLVPDARTKANSHIA